MSSEGITPADSPNDRSDPTSPDSRLTPLFSRHFKVAIGPRTLSLLRWYLSQVGTANADDLLAAIFLECWQIQAGGAVITEDEIRRAADRVRQRLLRESRRAVSNAAIDQTPSVDLPPDDEAELVIRDFQTFLRNRSPEDALIFQLFYLDNRRDIPALASELGMSTATIYRRLASIRSDYLSLRDLRQPPHAAD